MTSDELKKLRALADAATPGPWSIISSGKFAHVREIEGDMLTQDAAFIAQARDVIPKLLDEVEELKASYGLLAKDSLANCKHIEELHKERDSRRAEVERLAEAYIQKVEDWCLAMSQRDRALVRIEKLRDALKFYAAKTNESEWDGCKFLTFDKFGCLDEEISGPFVANRALAEDDKEAGG